MTNLERWHFYNKGLFSPDLLITWGWYATVAAALERRVFFDNEERPLLPCMYTVFIAPAGVGKGLVYDECRRIITQEVAPSPPSAKFGMMQLNHIRPGSGERMAGERNLLFKMAADSTTFESLLVETTEATEMYKNHRGEDAAQSALFFMLDEYASLFKMHAEDMITFLLTAWNGKDYTRKTKNKGHDHLRNVCINLLACTTPTEFAKILRREIVGSGILSRTMLVYAHQNRSRGIKLPKSTDEQMAAFTHLRKWIADLKKVALCIKYTPEAEEYLERWYADENVFRVNKNPRLDEYYVRKLSHVHKLVMAMHMSEPGFEKPVPRSTIEAAAALLETTERPMHFALTAGGRNPLSTIADQVQSYIGRLPGGASFNDILSKFMVDADFDEISEIINVLQVQDRIILNDKRYYEKK